MTTNIQADVYQSQESQALLNGNVSIVDFPGSRSLELYRQGAAAAKILSRAASTVNNLAFSTTFNAASAYRGIVLSTNVGLMRGVTFNAAFDIQSAAYLGIPTDILIANTNLLDGGQIYGVPLRQGNAGLAYQDNNGFGARLDATYIGGNNSWNRNPFWFANASVSRTSGPTTIGLGVYNLFNSVARRTGTSRLWRLRTQNFYGLGAQEGRGDVSRLEQSNEQFGLPFRSYWFTVKLASLVRARFHVAVIRRTYDSGMTRFVFAYWSSQPRCGWAPRLLRPARRSSANRGPADGCRRQPPRRAVANASRRTASLRKPSVAGTAPGHPGRFDLRAARR